MKRLCLIAPVAFLSLMSPRSAKADHETGDDFCSLYGGTYTGIVAAVSTAIASPLIAKYNDQVSGREAAIGSVVGVLSATVLGGLAFYAACDGLDDGGASMIIVGVGLLGGVGGPFLFAGLDDDQPTKSASAIRVGVGPTNDGGAIAQLVLGF